MKLLRVELDLYYGLSMYAIHVLDDKVIKDLNKKIDLLEENGHELYFGEIQGKHSEVSLSMKEVRKMFTVFDLTFDETSHWLNAIKTLAPKNDMLGNFNILDFIDETIYDYEEQGE